jgi:PEP-CTERM motif
MNRMRILVGSILGLFSVISLNTLPVEAQTTVGTFDAGNCYPFTCNDSGITSGQSIDYQQIYSASAFPGPVTFESITFFAFPGSFGSVISGNYDITFSTTASSLGADFPIGPLANTQTFFNGTLGGPIGTSYTIGGNAYQYNPQAGNLVMEVVVTDQADVPNGAGNAFFEDDDTGIQTSRAYSLSGGQFAGQSADNDGLVTEFSAVPEPSTWAAFVVGFGILGAVLRRERRNARIVAAAIPIRRPSRRVCVG